MCACANVHMCECKDVHVVYMCMLCACACRRDDILNEIKRSPLTCISVLSTAVTKIICEMLRQTQRLMWI